MQRQDTASLLRRLIRLEATALVAQWPGQASVEVWLPSNGRDDLRPGRYPRAGGKATLVVYDPGCLTTTGVTKTGDDPAGGEGAWTA